MNHNKVIAGSKIPDFSLPSTSGKDVLLPNLLNRKVILFIYPKDQSSTCTKQALEFDKNLNLFRKLNTDVYGVSKGSIESKKNFIKKHNLRIELLADDNLGFIKAIGAWKEKTMYGKKFMGIERTSILISEKGNILKIWRKVNFIRNIDDIIQVLKSDELAT